MVALNPEVNLEVIHSYAGYGVSRPVVLLKFIFCHLGFLRLGPNKTVVIDIRSLGPLPKTISNFRVAVVLAQSLETLDGVLYLVF